PYQSRMEPKVSTRFETTPHDDQAQGDDLVLILKYLFGTLCFNKSKLLSKFTQSIIMIPPQYERAYVSEITNWIISDPNLRLIAITGPRQTGKTTIALQIFSKLTESGFACKYCALDNPSVDELGSFDLYNSDEVSKNQLRKMINTPNEETLLGIWENGRIAAQQSKRGFVLFLDEIQIIPRWSNIVKGLWDADRRNQCPLRVVILGSAPWRMLTGMNESLMGRFDAFPISHWTLKEMSYVFDFNIDEYMYFGGYPGPWTGKMNGYVKNLDVAEPLWKKYILNSIIEPAINRDIIAQKRIEKPALMRQIIDLAPNYSGQIISYNKMLEQLQDAGNTTTLAKYIDLLMGAGLMTTLSRFKWKPLSGRRASVPKLNVLNTALMTANSVYTFQDAKNNPSFWGRIAESAVGAHLYNTRDYGTHIHYWRDTNNQNEVDYVIVRGENLIGIEVKSGKVRTRRGLRAFKDSFPHARVMLVGGEEMPFNEFFSLKPEEFFDIS
ncbi:MAG: ATP-binding protein, partial [Bacteroidetes bacterium]|nr:ATP-binding protein [Bacteroidota bacterium]